MNYYYALELLNKETDFNKFTKRDLVLILETFKKQIQKEETKISNYEKEIYKKYKEDGSFENIVRSNFLEKIYENR